VAEDLLELSSRIIDSGRADVPVNRVTQELSELGDGVAVVESFSHCVAIDTGEGLVCFDASGAHTGAAVVEALRRWRTDPVAALVYTHGHVDHVGGSGAFAADAQKRGAGLPRVVAHAAVQERFDRYRRTDGWNQAINRRQFGGISPRQGLGLGAGERFLPDDVVEPTEVVGERHQLAVGGLAVELRHARGETDDHLWAWLPERRAICAGDFVIWNFPNAGNPQKVQRYPLEWAAALREMVALEPELLLPGPRPAHRRARPDRPRAARWPTRSRTSGRRRAGAHERGADLDRILHEVRVDADVLERPWLRPLYDEPEFVVRNVWRLYGGWWDGQAASLKPAPVASLATELADLAGGAHRLATRARELSDAGELRLACHLADLAAGAAPDDVAVHSVRAEIYQARRDQERSLMAKGIYAAAARESRAVATPEARYQLLQPVAQMVVRAASVRASSKARVASALALTSRQRPDRIPSISGMR
jgi:alkyl sulfatase BDS1-like metallo-beta-lactamase superfamily hydrolase